MPDEDGRGAGCGLRALERLDGGGRVGVERAGGDGVAGAGAVTGQVDRLDVVPGRAQQRRQLVPGPGSVPGAVDEDEGRQIRSTSRAGSPSIDWALLSRM